MIDLFTLEITPEISQQDLEDRYLALLERFPPDTHPEEFARLNVAYNRMRTQRARIWNRIDPLFNLEGLLETAQWKAQRQRLTTDEVAALLRRPRTAGDDHA